MPKIALGLYDEIRVCSNCGNKEVLEYFDYPFLSKQIHSNLLEIGDTHICYDCIFQGEGEY